MKYLFVLFIVLLVSCESVNESIIPETEIICLNENITIHPLNFKIISNLEVNSLVLNQHEILFEKVGKDYCFSTNEMMIRLTIIYKNNLSSEHFLYYRY